MAMVADDFLMPPRDARHHTPFRFSPLLMIRVARYAAPCLFIFAIIIICRCRCLFIDIILASYVTPITLMLRAPSRHAIYCVRRPAHNSATPGYVPSTLFFFAIILSPLFHAPLMMLSL